MLRVENGIEVEAQQCNHWQMAEAVGALFDKLLADISFAEFIMFVDSISNRRNVV
ncbi:hypothetical protein [Deinococcus multiflagellatus]|uniref:Uncharacterized protein n=1 Tax=Deinococcus multiflagellatus TaxID=1656887 RepID=A0ABW1ZJS2_9DEIO